MTIVCSREDCTVADTGICILGNATESCPELQNDSSNQQVSPDEASTRPVLDTESQNPTFAHSLTLTPDATFELMCSRYCHLIGILGSPDAGKTAALVSMYLLAAHDSLSGFSFRRSVTLRALEDISIGARRWNEGMAPEEMTNHTELPSGRPAGFLHLRLAQSATGKTKDLLLPDLPGEWSTSLIDDNVGGRLSFLRASEKIWIMLDGEQIEHRETRQSHLHRIKLLIARLALLIEEKVPLFLVITRRDLMTEEGLNRVAPLLEEARRFGFPAQVFAIASFAKDENFVPGSGIAELLSATLESQGEASDFWPDHEPLAVRSFGNFRHRGH